jgi:hypothetical protein
MICHTRGFIPRRRPSRASALCAVVPCFVLAACGSSSIDGSSPLDGTPRLLAHVLTRDGSLRTYGVDVETGALTSVGAQSVPQAQQLAVDPSGRFVFVVRWNGKVWWGLAPEVHELQGQPYVGGCVRSYRVSPRTGALAFVSECDAGLQAKEGPGAITASPGLLHTVWGQIGGSSGSHVFYDLVRFAVSSDGVVTRAAGESWGLNHTSGPGLVADRQRGLFYGRHGDSSVAAYAMDGDGALRLASEASVPEVGTPGCPYDDLRQVTSMVAADGLVYMATESGSSTPCGGIFYPFRVVGAPPVLTAEAPQAAPGDSSVLAFLPPSAGAAGLLAVGSTGGIRVYDAGASGGLTLRAIAAADVAPGRVSSLTFHPSGRFLYATYPSGLSTFALTSDATLRLVRTDPSISGKAFEPAGHLVIAPAPTD